MKILVICRDNIGDSILATPLIAHLSTIHGATTDVLTNSYASPVFSHNPHIRKVHEYSKSKHCKNLISVIVAVAVRLKTIFRLRKEKYDAVIIAKSSWDPHSVKWAAGIGAKRVIAFGDEAHPLIDTLVSRAEGTLHIAERLFRLGAAVTDAPPLRRFIPGKSSVYPAPDLVTKFRMTCGVAPGERIIALQISARKPAQQWSASNFITLAHLIAERYRCRMFLFWSPGDSSNPMHPGDDIKAEYITGLAARYGLEAVPTCTLEELKAALSLCSAVVSSDGGAVHVAAALGLPVVALYGNSEPAHWHPWHVPHQALRGSREHVNDISPENVMNAIVPLISPAGEQGASAWSYASRTSA
ncbi:glycosyltransferase family 9 protein [Pantoea sp. JGM49]|uniref:glycosyltransferase family 9 protein n=1 Tax=Pantoea sp. JGM49 TaxID=2799791 RepID=UPI001BA5559A|nr:glycosyltransferase family 9 protein [Pantoea sp. JGM49]